MENAKKELLEDLENKPKVLCAWIGYDELYNSDKKYRKYITLKQNYTEEDFNAFLELLNFNYDSGFGGQELYGYVWFEDGTWLERGEYDGSEWWYYNKVLDIPEDLKA